MALSSLSPCFSLYTGVLPAQSCFAHWVVAAELSGWVSEPNTLASGARLEFSYLARIKNMLGGFPDFLLPPLKLSAKEEEGKEIAALQE